MQQMMQSFFMSPGYQDTAALSSESAQRPPLTMIG